MLVFNNWNGKANNAQWFFLKTKKKPNDFLIFHFISLRMLLTREIKKRLPLTDIYLHAVAFNVEKMQLKIVGHVKNAFGCCTTTTTNN